MKESDVAGAAAQEVGAAPGGIGNRRGRSSPGDADAGGAREQELQLAGAARTPAARGGGRSRGPEFADCSYGGGSAAAQASAAATAANTSSSCTGAARAEKGTGDGHGGGGHGGGGAQI